jgi:Fur family peroxide stress response transcriptional regulator
MNLEEIGRRLSQKGLKVTPQRMAVLDAILSLNNHPTADNILEYIRKNHPHIAVATIYKVLDVLYEKKLIQRVKTEKDIMRYDGELESHHHIYYSDSDRIEDYKDDGLNQMLKQYFEDHSLSGFLIEDIRLQLIGRYQKPHNK